MIVLPPRLRMLAELIPVGARVVDVGTDHARLPAYLVQKGIAKHVLATDVREGPLTRARRTLVACGTEEHVTLHLVDGLTGLTAEQYDTVVVAGMGADTMISILKKALPTHALLLLQPMSHAERLRDFLGQSGYRIDIELLAREDRRLYNILAARYGGQAVPPTPPERYVSRALAGSHDPHLKDYLHRQTARLAAEARGLLASDRAGDGVLLRETRAALEGLLELQRTLFAPERQAGEEKT